MKSSLLLSTALLVACGGTEAPERSAAPASAPRPAAPTATKVEACKLLTKAEVEAAIGRPTLEPRQEDVVEHSFCAFGDPKDSTAAAGGIASSLVDLGVTLATGPTGGKGILDIARSNAASVEDVAGLGEGAYWDKILRALRAAKGQYQIDLSVASDAGGVTAARTLAEKALARLP